MSQSPITEKSNLVSFAILSNGSEIQSQYYDQIVEITVEQEINKISEAEILIRDGDAPSQSFPIADSSTFIPGTKIEIQMGYEGQNQTVFVGLIVKMNVTVDEFDGARLRIFCRDAAMKSAITRKNLIYLNQKDSDIVSQIASSYGLDTDISSTTVENKEMVQYYSSDWDFMVARAEANGMFIVTDSGKLVMAAPTVSDSAALDLNFGFDVHEFDCELDATFQLSGVQSNSWDISTQAVINATAATPSLNDQGNISSSTLASTLDVGTANMITDTPMEQDAIQAWADAALLKSGLSRFKGTMTFQGSALAKVNSTISLNGFSGRFDGNAFISGVTHQVNAKGWMTEIKIGLSEKWYSENPTNSGPIAAGLLPGVKGLQIGIVKKIDQDPDNEFRVQVQIPILADDANMVWARLSSFYVGNSFGAVFMPEINDEVILGFMNDDPRYPIILGSVFSTAIPSPITPDEKNSIKTIITSSMLQIKFDDENKILTLLTPAGNTAVLSDKDKGITLTDQTGNVIQMNDQGITITSKSDMTLKATNGLNLQGATVSIKGDNSISESSPSISVTGDQSVSITGSGGLSMTSDGETTIKGSMVMIN